MIKQELTQLIEKHQHSMFTNPIKSRKSNQIMAQIKSKHGFIRLDQHQSFAGKIFSLIKFCSECRTEVIYLKVISNQNKTICL